MNAWRCLACKLVNWSQSAESPDRCYAHPNDVNLPEVTFELLSASEALDHQNNGGLAIFSVRKVVGPILCPACRKRTTRKKLETSGICGSCDTTQKRGKTQ